MPFSGTMYSEVSSGAYLIDDMLKDYKNRLDAAQTEPGGILSSLTAFGTEWGPIVDAINALATAQPTNAAILNLQSHINNLLTDYGTILARAQAMDTALNPPPP